MSENYIVINGKKMDLTEEQLKRLGIAVRKNPFERVKNGKTYWCVDENNDLCDYREQADFTDTSLYDAVNYFNDDAFANQVALHQLLYRKLLKFAYDNEYHDTAEWDGENQHWGIYYNRETHTYAVDCYGSHQHVGYWFSSREGAEQAIEEVIKPFIKEHPEFVW